MYRKTWKNYIGLKIDYKQIFLDICGCLLYYFAVILNVWWLNVYILFFLWLTLLIYLVIGLFMYNPKFKKEIETKEIPYPYWIYMVVFLTKLGIFAFGGWYVSSLIILVSGLIHYMAFYAYIKE